MARGALQARKVHDTRSHLQLCQYIHRFKSFFSLIDSESFLISLLTSSPYLKSLQVKEFRKSVEIWQNYGHEFGVQFFGPRCRPRRWQLGDRRRRKGWVVGGTMASAEHEPITGVWGRAPSGVQQSLKNVPGGTDVLGKWKSVPGKISIRASFFTSIFMLFYINIPFKLIVSDALRIAIKHECIFKNYFIVLFGCPINLI